MILEAQTKICSMCKKEKAITGYNKRKRSKDGLESYCKDCSKRMNEKYRKNNPEKIKENGKEYYENNKERIKESKKKYYKNNKEETNKKHKKYRENNKEKEIQRRKLYYENNKEKIEKTNKKYRENNRKKVRGNKRNWKRNNPEKVKASGRNTFNKRRTACKYTDITTDFLVQLKEETKICPICKVIMNDISYHSSQYNLDHIITLNSGGTHTMSNVRYICRSCNLKRPKDSSDIKKRVIN